MKIGAFIYALTVLVTRDCALIENPAREIEESDDCYEYKYSFYVSLIGWGFEVYFRNSSPD
jgi:hypothetical protein